VLFDGTMIALWIVFIYSLVDLLVQLISSR